MKIIIFFVCFIGVIFFSASFQDSCNSIVSNVVSIVFVFSGTVIATLVSYPVEKIRRVKDVLQKVYSTDVFDYAEKTRRTIQLAREYKRLGFKVLEEGARDIGNDYLKLGLQLIADNSSWDHIKATLEKEFIFDSLQNDCAERITRSMAKYAPAFGLAGTIIGLMRIFPQLSNPEHIGSSMSLALLTTLYGVLLSNLVFLPLANKLKDTSADDEIMYRFVLEALQCVRSKEYSIVIEQRLSALMPKHDLVKYKAEKPENMKLRIAESG